MELITGLMLFVAGGYTLMTFIKIDNNGKKQISSNWFMKIMSLSNIGLGIYLLTH